MRTVGAYEAKTHLSSLLDSVLAGEEIIITRNGSPVAILSPCPYAKRPIDETIQEILILRTKVNLGGLSIEDLKKEGRR